MQHDLQSVLHDMTNPATLIGAACYAVAFAIAALIAGRAVHLAVERTLVTHRSKVDPTALKFLGQFTRLAIYIVAALFYVHHIPVLRELGSLLLASVGLVSVIVGLAAQSTLGNLVAGLSLLLYRPF